MSKVLVTALLLAAALPAQVVVETWCIGGSAQAGNDYRSLPAGRLTTGVSVRASDAANGCSAAADLAATPLGAGAVFQTSARLTTNSLCQYWTAGTSGNFVVTFAAPVPTAGVVTVTAQGTPGLLFPTASYTLDIGDDGTIELRSPGASGQQQGVSFSTVLGPKPLRVRLALATSLSILPGTSASTDLSVAIGFSGTGGWWTSVGTPCGAGLAGYVVRTTSTLFRLEATQAPVTPHGFFAFGVSEVHLVVPPTLCVLRTDLLLALPVPVQPDGTATLVFALPNSIQGVVRTQFLAGNVDGQNVERWWLSNAIRMALP